MAGWSVLSAKPAEIRLRQAVLLLAGALVLEVLVARGSTPFFWTPLILGLTYTAVATAGGRDGGHWATACGLVGWGAAVAWIGSSRPAGVDPAGAYLLGAGAGVAAAALLARAGYAADALGAGLTVAAGGAALAFSSHEPRLEDAQTYAVALAVVAAANIALALSGRGGRGSRTSRRRS